MTWKTVWDIAAFGVCALICFTLFSLIDGDSLDVQLVVRLTLSALAVRFLLLLVRGSLRWRRQRRSAGTGLPTEPYGG
jgi:hypothetical protein